MKNSWFVLILIMFLTLLLAPLAQATVVTTGSEPVPQPKVISTTGNEPVPLPPPPTAKEIATAVREELGDLRGVKGEIAKKDAKTAAAPLVLDNTLRGKKSANDNTQKFFTKQLVASGDRIIGFMGAAVLLILIAIAVLAWFLYRQVKMVPTDTAKLVKQWEPITIDFEVLGYKVFYTPPVNGGYLSLYVPKVGKEEISDPSRIPRLSCDTRGKLFNSTLGVMTAFLDKKYEGSDVHSRQQKEVIRFTLATKELRIMRVTKP